MPDRCEVLPGDGVVARRDGGLLWVDAPGSPALVAALHACLGVSGPGADRVLAAVASAAAVVTPPATQAPAPSFTARSDAGFGAAPAVQEPDSGEQTAFWRPEQAAPILRFDDGMVITVDEDLVLGRRPDNHE